MQTSLWTPSRENPQTLPVASMTHTERHDQLCFIRSGLEKGIRIPNTADTFSSNQKHLHKVTVWNATKAIFCNAKLQQINLFLCWQNLMIYLKIFGKTKKIHSWIQVQSVLEGRSCVLLSILSLSKKKALSKGYGCINKRRLIMINNNLKMLALTKPTPALPIQ